MTVLCSHVDFNAYRWIWNIDDHLVGQTCTELSYVVLAALSLLERLMKHVDLYLKDERGEFTKRFVTKLLRNYRHVHLFPFL